MKNCEWYSPFVPYISPLQTSEAVLQVWRSPCCMHRRSERRTSKKHCCSLRGFPFCLFLLHAWLRMKFKLHPHSFGTQQRLVPVLSATQGEDKHKKTRRTKRVRCSWVEAFFTGFRCFNYTPQESCIIFVAHRFHLRADFGAFS